MTETGKKNAVYRFFNSKVLAIVLIALIGFFAFLGTVIPQEDVFSHEEILDHNARRPISRTLDSVLSVFQISEKDPWKSSVYSIYHSWWFLLLVLMLTTNLVVCSYDKLKSLKGLYRKLEGEPDDKRFKTMKTGANLSISGTMKDVENVVEKWTRKKFRIRESVSDKSRKLFRVQTQRFSRLGYLLVHIGLLFVFVGAVISSFTREKGTVWLTDGESTDVYYSRTAEKEVPLGYTLKADDLEQEIHRDGRSVQDWFSTLTIVRDGKEVAKKRIEVNDPLKFEGRMFYQSGWREGGYKLKVKATEVATGREEIFEINIDSQLTDREKGKTYKFLGGEAFLKVDHFYPYFTMSGKKFGTRSMELRNPAVIMQVYWEGLKQAQRKVLFSRFPEMDFNQMHDREGTPAEEPYKFLLLPEIETTHMTGIEIGEDPGTDVVYFGFFLMILGVFVGFYFYHQRIWIHVSGKGKKTDILMAGNVNRNRYQFERKFERIAKQFVSFLADELGIDEKKIKIDIKK